MFISSHEPSPLSGKTEINPLSPRSQMHSSSLLRQHTLSHQPFQSRDPGRSPRTARCPCRQELRRNARKTPHVCAPFTNGRTGPERSGHWRTLTQLARGSRTVNSRLSNTKRVLSVPQAPTCELDLEGYRDPAEMLLVQAWGTLRRDLKTK